MSSFINVGQEKKSIILEFYRDFLILIKIQCDKSTIFDKYRDKSITIELHQDRSIFIELYRDQLILIERKIVIYSIGSKLIDYNRQISHIEIY